MNASQEAAPGEVEGHSPAKEGIANSFAKRTVSRKQMRDELLCASFPPLPYNL